MTRPRALFVDDEPRVLDGLRRSLRSKRGEWDMAFATGGVEAVELLRTEQYDVVVSDMRMPGMDGAELLANVSERHPEVARVVLSGHIEADSVFKVAVAGHRFLSKPSDAESVIGVIEQLLVRTSSSHQREARRIAGGVRSIPTLPEHTEGIIALLAPDASLSYAVQIAMRDVGLTAKLLQLSNSRFFGSRPRNSSVESIVSAMGVPMLQAVVGAGHALHESIASPANRPHAQAAGLLQDVGRLVCLALEGDQIGAVDLATTTVAGVPFRDVGVELLHLWGVPPPIVVAVAQRDTPQRPQASGLGVAAAVRAAHLLIEQAEAGSEDDGGHDDELALLLAHPQLKAQAVNWRQAAEDSCRRAGL